MNQIDKTEEKTAVKSIVGTLVWTNRYHGETDFQHPAEIKEQRATDWIVEYLEPGRGFGDPQQVGRFLNGISFVRPAYSRKYGFMPEGSVPKCVHDWMMKKQEEKFDGKNTTKNNN